MRNEDLVVRGEFIVSKCPTQERKLWIFPRKYQKLGAVFAIVSLPRLWWGMLLNPESIAAEKEMGQAELGLLGRDSAKERNFFPVFHPPN